MLTEADKLRLKQERLFLFKEEIKKEIFNLVSSPLIDCKKDILIVVKDQLFYVQKCIESIRKNTINYNLYIYDNNSSQETKDYLNSITDAKIITSDKNDGFIIPNNILASISDSEYLILLNSDTEVSLNWDTTLISWMKSHPDIAISGYCGSLIDSSGKGGFIKLGYDIDYVCGWCMCIPRKIYNKFGLFDQDNLKLAYFEDSDLCYRVREAGYKIYAMHCDLVEHHENKTILEINKDPEQSKIFFESFQSNQAYFKRRWQSAQSSLQS